MKVLALLLVVARVAHADDVGYATLDRQDDSTKLSAQLSYLEVKNLGQFARLDLSGQVIKPRFGAGFYAKVPVSFESDSGANTTIALGGFEAGGIYVSPVGLVLHAGVVLPTADVTNQQASFTASFARTIDLAQSLPDATVLRGGISYSFRSCQVFGRIELGVDAVIDQSNNSTPIFDGQILHVDAALGLDADAFTLTFESTNTYGIGTTSPSYAAIATAIRFRAGQARPYLATVIPLDNQFSEPRIALIAGVDVWFGSVR